MAIRIATNVSAQNVVGWLARAQQGVDKSMERLSSGYRINHAADDAAGLAISNQFRHQIAGLKTAYNNASQAINMVRTAEGTLNQLVDMTKRLKELAIEAASDTVDSTRRSTLNSEATNLITEMVNMAKSTEYADVSLFSISGQLLTFGVGLDSASANKISVTINNITDSSDIGLQTINLANLTSAQSSIDYIDNALTSINSWLGNIGKAENRLTYRQAELQTTIQNFTASDSVIRDTDMAAEMANFTKNQILVQSGMAMLAQANALPNNVLTLLR